MSDQITAAEWLEREHARELAGTRDTFAATANQPEEPEPNE